MLTFVFSSFQEVFSVQLHYWRIFWKIICLEVKIPFFKGSKIHYCKTTILDTNMMVASQHV